MQIFPASSWPGTVPADSLGSAPLGVAGTVTGHDGRHRV